MIEIFIFHKNVPHIKPADRDGQMSPQKHNFEFCLIFLNYTTSPEHCPCLLVTKFGHTPVHSFFVSQSKKSINWWENGDYAVDYIYICLLVKT